MALLLNNLLIRYKSGQANYNIIIIFILNLERILIQPVIFLILYKVCTCMYT